VQSPFVFGYRPHGCFDMQSRVKLKVSWRTLGRRVVTGIGTGVVVKEDGPTDGFWLRARGLLVICGLLDPVEEGMSVVPGANGEGEVWSGVGVVLRTDCNCGKLRYGSVVGLICNGRLWNVGF
jgi:hypothetical protein